MYDSTYTAYTVSELRTFSRFIVQGYINTPWAGYTNGFFTGLVAVSDVYTNDGQVPRITGYGLFYYSGDALAVPIAISSNNLSETTTAILLSCDVQANCLITSPDGSLFALAVDDDGNLSADKKYSARS